MKLFIALLISTFLVPGVLGAGDKRASKKLEDADRVLLLGGGFIEQERLHCYLETRLLRHHPRGSLLFRNLGWGGDTVRGTARTGGFQNPEGFARLFKEVTQWKPSVILVGYGMNESFEGIAGIDAFVKDYNSLLDKLAPLRARVILLSPTFHEPLGHPYPDPAEHNAQIKSYATAIQDLALKRNLATIDLLQPMLAAKDREPKRVFTTNGIQPNANGYALIARIIEQALGYAEKDARRITLSARGEVKDAEGVKASPEKLKRGLRLSLQDHVLPITDPLGSDMCLIRITDLPDGMHALEIEDQVVVRASAREWDQGVSVPLPSQTGETLRQAIITKNDLFYRRWRPFNDHSRHFDFLKGDFSLYDQEIAELERQIQSMLTPRSYSIEIVPLGK